MKILLMTTVYPRNDALKTTTATKVIHYFAAEWQKMGHQVLVINNVNKLPFFVYYLPRKLKEIIKTKTGYEVPDVQITKQSEYKYEEIKVIRLPIFKLIPRGVHSKRQIKLHCKKINKMLLERKYEPDLIVGHWASPHVQILSELKEKYNCRNAVVLHDLHYLENDRYGINKCFKNIDVVGCRSKTMALRVKDILELEYTPFVCSSGIPDKYVEQAEFMQDKNNENVNRFIYVGELIKRKNVDTIIRALASVTDKVWHLDIVGIGKEKEYLEKLAVDLGVTNRITFHGRVTREVVLELLKGAHCFTMVSKGEAFGLVYLEAMIASCITVGSRYEGIDGIICDGDNGFLCEAGNVEQLRAVYKKIFNMSDCERSELVKRAYYMAKEYTDSNCARKYLEEIK